MVTLCDMESDIKAREERYLADFVMTATPVQRLLMLFAHLRSDLANAEEAFEAHDIKKINDALVHAQQILMALRDVLDPEIPLCATLRDLYSFCINQLIAANLRKDRSLIAAVRSTIEKITDANEKAAAAESKVGTGAHS